MPSERTLIAQHATTVLVGQLAVMAYSVTDSVVAGRYSVEAQAALSVAAAIFITVYISLLAAVQGLLPAWAELLGAGREGEVGASVRQSLYLTAALTLLGMGLLVAAPQLLPVMEVPAFLHADIREYLYVLAAALPAAMGYRIFSTLSQSVGLPHMATWLQLAGLAIKIPLSVALVQGRWGLPELGIAGCAWATLAVHVTLLALAIALTLRRVEYRRLRLWRRLEAADGATLRGFARLALPAGLVASIEVSSFSLMAMLIARQGAEVASSHQIASNVAGVCYMFPLSLAIATSARVSYWRGAGHEWRAQRIARNSLGVAVLLCTTLAALLLALRGGIAALYTPEPQVQALTTALLAWIALYHIADGIQITTIFLLRSWRVTLAPMLIYPVLLWGCGVLGGYVIAYRGIGPWPAVHAAWPFWAASAVGLAITSALLLLVLRRRIRKEIGTRAA